MQDIMEKVTKYTGLLKLSSAEVVTPMNIVKDMVDLLPSEILSPESTFLDPAVKSGRFLIELFNRLMESPAMIEAFPNAEERKKKILTEQLFGLATSETTAAIVRKALYDDPNETGNIRYTADKFSKELIQGAFHIMQFDVVIGNPPYNKGMDLDFVFAGFEIIKKDGYEIMITPAKWQTADADQAVQSKNINYGKFRKTIVPYISYVCYYPNSTDIFQQVYQIDGLSYFMIRKTMASRCIVENKQDTIIKKINSIMQSYNRNYDGSKAIRSLNNAESLLNIGQEIIDLIHCKKHFTPDSFKNRHGKYTVWINNLIPGNQQVSAGGFIGIGKHYISSDRPNKM